MVLVEAFHGTAAMARVGAPWLTMGSSRRGKRGGGEGRGATRLGGRDMGRGRGLGPYYCSGCSLLLLAVHEEEEHVGKKGKRRERKRKEMEIFLNLEIFR
jgi:hypothetical protein